MSAYAIGPNWGSEVGMGWNWIINLSQHHQLYVITERGFQDDIEKKINILDLKNEPKFFYVDIDSKARELFWKQGSFIFYFYYKRWQKNSYQLSKSIIAKYKIDIIHQLNLIGFREPGFLWLHSNEVPSVWGPIGGFNQVPFRFLIKMRFKNLIYYLIKNILNYLQIMFSRRVRKAFNSTSILIADSSSTSKLIKKYYNKTSVIINETGCNPSSKNSDFRKSHASEMTNGLRILWVGQIQGLKALPLAIDALKEIAELIPIKMTVVGDGPDFKYCQNLVNSFLLNQKVNFIGRVQNSIVLEMMDKFDLLFFTSLKEGTPHVVLEALSQGLPVLCHDICGHGDIIDSSCGIKIPMLSYSKSVKLFKENLLLLSNNKNKLQDLSLGALKKSHSVSWQKKIEEMNKIYGSISIKKTTEVKQNHLN